MINTKKIDFDNFEQFPVGTKIEFHFGAYYPICEGQITGYEIVPACKWFPADVRLTAEYFCHEDEEMVQTTITSFVDKGIGTYLIETAEPETKPTRSPWAA